MAHDRLRRAAEENNLAENAVKYPVNGSLFASGNCILLYSKGLTLEVNNVSFDVLNDTGMTYTVSPVCQNTSNRYVLLLSVGVLGGYTNCFCNNCRNSSKLIGRR